VKPGLLAQGWSIAMNVMKRIFLSAAMSVPMVIVIPRTLFAQHFAKPIDYPVGPLPSALAAGDFNRDGNVDLVVTIENGVRLLLGNGKGEFQSTVDLGIAQSSTSIALGDFNEDHKLDLVIAGTSGSLQHSASFKLTVK
jgi:hypothetical protein